MKKGTIIGLAILAVVLVVGTIIGAGIFGYGYNTVKDCRQFEVFIKGQTKTCEVTYDKMWKVIKEVAQVPDAMTADLEKITKAAIQGRYGDKGSQAVFQFIQEQNPSIDPAVYRKIQTVMEANRTEFLKAQEMLIDKATQYESYLTSPLRSMVAGFFGHPKVDLDSIKIITSERTENAYQTGKDDMIRLKD